MPSYEDSKDQKEAPIKSYEQQIRTVLIPDLILDAMAPQLDVNPTYRRAFAIVNRAQSLTSLQRQEFLREEGIDASVWSQYQRITTQETPELYRQFQEIQSLIQTQTQDIPFAKLRPILETRIAEIISQIRSGQSLEEISMAIPTTNFPREEEPEAPIEGMHLRPDQRKRNDIHTLRREWIRQQLTATPIPPSTKEILDRMRAHDQTSDIKFITPRTDMITAIDMVISRIRVEGQQRRDTMRMQQRRREIRALLNNPNNTLTRADLATRYGVDTRVIDDDIVAINSFKPKRQIHPRKAGGIAQRQHIERTIQNLLQPTDPSIEPHTWPIDPKIIAHAAGLRPHHIWTAFGQHPEDFSVPIPHTPHEWAVARYPQIFALLDNNIPRPQIAEKLGVSESTITRAIRWRKQQEEKK